MKNKPFFEPLACAVLAASIATPAAAEDIVRVAVLPYMSQGVISIGIAEGYFEKEGITIERIDMRDPSPIVPGLMSGDIDLAFTIPSAGYYNAISRGGGARIVAPGVTFSQDHCDYGVIYGRNGFSREEVAATDGLDIKIAATPNTFQEYAVRMLNELEGVGDHNIEVSFVPPYSLGDAMGSEAIDMAMTSEPWIVNLNASGTGQVVAGFAEVLPDAQFTQLLFSKRLLEDNPDLGTRAMRALNASIEQYSEGKTPRNMEILAEFTGLDKALIETACWAYVPVNGEVHVPSIMEFQAWLKDKNLIDETLPAERFLASVPTK